MAVAAYASMVSLTHVLDNVHYRAQLRLLHVNIKLIESFQETVNFLLDFVEIHSRREGQKINSLWRQISEVSFEAEEIFDLHVVNQLQLRSEGVKACLGFSAFDEDIGGVIRKLDTIKKELLVEEALLQDVRSGKQPEVSEHGTISSLGQNTIVGFDDHVNAVMDLLIRDEPALQIIPIVGMGGIGKTTLARAVFDNQCIVDRFDRLVWLTISQEYTVQDILSALLNDGKVTTHDGSFDRLGEALYKQLFGRRYLIVMDDVWSEQAWCDLRMCFPNNNNGSRVIMTTRLANVAGSLSPQRSFSMTFLDKNKSWSLFCRTVFKKEHCPYPELEEIAQEIVRSCQGLPLEIIVIGGLLAKSNMSKRYWKSVADNISSFANLEHDEHCLKILSLSYNDLPIHLKACFLFMSAYREDHKIDINELIREWIARGLIRAVGEKSLEEIGMEYTKDLISRNLIFHYRNHRRNGKLEWCNIHDLLRELSVKEFNKAEFIQSPKVQYTNGSGSRRQCFLCAKSIHHEVATDVLEFVLLSESPSSSRLIHPPICRACRVMYSHFKEARLVETMMFERTSRFLHPTQVREGFIILKNLQTLSGISNFQCTNDVLARIPQVKTLKITYGKNLHNLIRLQNLQSLKIRNAQENIAFPSCLKELCLEYSKWKIPWSGMSIIGSLPNLEKLDLILSTRESEWNPAEGEFLRLKELKIACMDLVQWRADKEHFPTLELLVLSFKLLEEIPFGIGDIPTLRRIELRGCNGSAIDSAYEIWEEQKSMGNDILKIPIRKDYKWYSISDFISLQKKDEDDR
ncbi:putative late blight resistance protein homolog R1B-16 isoform X2 [Andrographis paniculata]|uniref:putative late blight resistance protein homolog R1B-16 isoform X2 n=1 Tax=Andrographis paniculata TaxID=175694 RepID=UPI0021E87808|nr:putative late blight resistance protein homolog R1B-16 isoform X2 [Andrographis paniculata]